MNAVIGIGETVSSLLFTMLTIKLKDTDDRLNPTVIHKLISQNNTLYLWGHFTSMDFPGEYPLHVQHKPKVAFETRWVRCCE